MTISDLFAAVDVSTVASNVGTLLIAFVGISLLFLGYRYVKRTMQSA